MGNVKFIEDVEYGGNTRLGSFVFEKEYVIISITSMSYLLLIMKNPILFMRRNNNNLNWKCIKEIH
ncbi:hypothetical protein AAG906_037935 [Vitis piasezkii]